MNIAENTPATPGANTAPVPQKGKWAVLSVLGMVPVLMVLNGTSVNVSISALVQDLDTSVSTIQAVLSLYALVTAVCMLPAAKLADRFGAKRIFPVGVILYACGALVVAAAQNGAMLLVGMSLIQGVAASIMMPTALSLLSIAYPGPQRTAALAAFSAVSSATMALSPILAGAVTTYLSWRLVFALELLVALLILLRVRLLRKIPAAAANKNARFDIVGALLSVVGLSCIIVGALLAKTYGWGVALRPFVLGSITLNAVSPAALLLAAGLLLCGALVWWLLRAKRTGRPALVDVSLFKNRRFDTVLLTKLLAQLTITGILFAVPVYLQNVLGYSALATGLSLLPLPALLLLAALSIVRLTRRLSKKTIITCGTLFVLAGTLVMWLIFANSTTISGLTLLPAVALLGLGMGCIMSPANTLALSSVPPGLANQGSGTLTTANNLASSLGTAITGSLLLGGIRSQVTTALAQDYPAQFGGYSRQQLSQLLAGAVDKMRAAAPALNLADSTQASSLQTTLTGALNSSMAHLALVMGGIAVAAVLMALLGLPRDKKAAGGR